MTPIRWETELPFDYSLVDISTGTAASRKIGSGRTVVAQVWDGNKHVGAVSLTGKADGGDYWISRNGEGEFPEQGSLSSVAEFASQLLPGLIITGE